MAHKRAKLEAPAVNSDINVTPLVDVMLVLLIIFMVVTPMLQKGQAVKLPLTANPEKKAEEKSQIMVVVTADKMYYVDKNRMPEAQFAGAIKEAYERNLNAPVVLKADARLSYGDVKKTMLKIKDAGFTNVGLVTEKRDKS
jgi:biopolymer transport protein ExbD